MPSTATVKAKKLGQINVRRIDGGLEQRFLYPQSDAEGKDKARFPTTAKIEVTLPDEIKDPSAEPPQFKQVGSWMEVIDYELSAEDAARLESLRADDVDGDDLTEIPGIGAVTATALIANGIKTKELLLAALEDEDSFAELAASPDIKASESDLEKWKEYLSE